MPSINLLPENFTIEAYKKREKAAIYVLAVFFVVASVLSYALVEMEKRDVEANAKTADVEIAKVKQQITEEIEKSDLLSSEYNKTDIEAVLGEHLYLSKGVSFLKETILQNVYVQDYESDGADSTLAMTVTASDYDMLIRQVLVFEDNFWVEAVDLGDIEKAKDDGSVSVGVTLTFRKGIFGFREQYRDFGIGYLSSRVSRYVEISSYDVSIADSETVESDDGKQSELIIKKVLVTFEGKAYDKTHLDDFEKSLKTDEADKVTLNRFSLADDKPGVLNFRGSVVLNY